MLSTSNAVEGTALQLVSMPTFRSYEIIDFSPGSLGQYAELVRDVTLLVSGAYLC